MFTKSNFHTPIKKDSIILLMNINSRKYFVELLWSKCWFIKFMAPLFGWRADKANDLQLESDPRVAGSVVIGSGTNANYCRGVFIFKDLDASQEATPHNWINPLWIRVLWFISLHHPATKNQIPNVSRRLLLLLLQFEKRKDSLACSLFELQQNNLAYIWCLVVGF